MRQHAADNEHADRITEAGKNIFLFETIENMSYILKRERTENLNADGD